MTGVVCNSAIKAAERDHDTLMRLGRIPQTGLTRFKRGTFHARFGGEGRDQTKRNQSMSCASSVYTQVCMHTHTHMYMYIHIYTHIQSSSKLAAVLQARALSSRTRPTKSS